MPSSVSIMCQIKSKELKGGFFNGSASYMQSVSKNFRYGFFKKQVSPFLHNVEIGDYVLLCGKCVFDNGNMHVNIHFFNYKNIIMKTLIEYC